MTSKAANTSACGVVQVHQPGRDDAQHDEGQDQERRRLPRPGEDAALGALAPLCSVDDDQRTAGAQGLRSSRAAAGTLRRRRDPIRG